MDIPIQVLIDWEEDEGEDAFDQTVTNVSLGGLAFISPQPIAVLEQVQISVPIIDRDSRLVGSVVWCEKCGAGYEIGVEFERNRDVYRLRMIEQICHIEHYRKQALEHEGRELSSREAACEWIERFAGDFPPL